MPNKMRIAKFIANAGFCSRREAEKLIESKEEVTKTLPLVDFFNVIYESNNEGVYFLRNLFFEIKLINFLNNFSEDNKISVNKSNPPVKKTTYILKSK